MLLGEWEVKPKDSVVKVFHYKSCSENETESKDFSLFLYAFFNNQKPGTFPKEHFS